MLNLKNNENNAVFDEICKKKAKIKIQFQKKWRVFWIASSGEKSPTATGIHITSKLKVVTLFSLGASLFHR